jgi:hypothetical protein
MKLIKSKKIHINIILIFLSLISLVTLAQAPVDTIKLTPQEFHTIWLEHEMDPPVFIQAKQKENNESI